MAINDFTLDWTKFLYSFSHFSILGQFLQKLEMDQAQAILICPNWSTHPWYQKKPLLLPKHPSKAKASTIQPRTAPPPWEDTFV